VAIKVETNGASGIGNKLTAEDIKKAKGVIIAADKAVEMDRFDGKPLILKPVAAGIREPENLIKAVLSGNLPTYKATGQAQENNSEEKLSIGKAFYKHLMSGVSSMLPFVIGGGIAIAIAFLIDNAMGVPKDQLANLVATMN
jgi:PTS system fructose-specific IIC component